MSEIEVPFAKPDISRSEIEAVTEVLLSGWLTSGSVATEFENLFAQAVNAEHAVALNSCTAAMHLALLAIGVGPGDEVIIPSLTFASTAEVVIQVGATPVFIDIDSTSYNLDTSMLSKAYSSNTKAIIPIDYGGTPPELDKIIDWAHSRNVVVIEDAAHGFPSSFKNKPIGSISDITCFSFYATKTITSGEGGMLVTNNHSWAKEVRLLSLHGITKDAWHRSSEGSRSWKYDVVRAGWKYNLSDISAALGLAQLHRANEMLRRRRCIAEIYSNAIEQLDCLDTLKINNRNATSWHLFVVKLNKMNMKIDRDFFIKELAKRGVGTSVHFKPLHMCSFYKEKYAFDDSDFPCAQEAFTNSLSLPIYSGMTELQVKHVVKSLREICNIYAI